MLCELYGLLHLSAVAGGPYCLLVSTMGTGRLSDEQQAVLLLAQAPKSVFYFVRSFLPGAGATFVAFFSVPQAV